MKNFFILLLSSFIINVTAQDVLYLNGSGATPNLTIQSGAAVYVEGGYVANSGASGMELDGDLYIGSGTGFTANWTDNMASSSVLGTSTGTAHFESNVQQNITGANTQFYNVIINNTSTAPTGIDLLSNIEVKNQITFQDGKVDANSNILYISTNSATAVTFLAPNNSTYDDSWVAAIYPNGRLDRNITNSASVFDFPVGSSTVSQLLQVTPTSISGGTGISRFSASWEASVTGASPISISECGTPYSQVHTAGEWHLRPANGGTLGTGSFTGGNMTIRGWNLSTFPGLIDNQFAILVRLDGSANTFDWQVPGPSCTSLAATGTSGRTLGFDNALRNNLTSFSDNTSQLGIGMTTIILPIELLTFSGYNAGDVNELFWSTSSELNSDYFSLEKSTAGITYESIGNIPAAGFSTDQREYQFTDFKPNHGLNYYRLKMIDKDQTFSYSNVVLIQLHADGLITAVVSPNPTIDNINIQIQSDKDEVVILQLTDELGRILKTKKWEVTQGINVTSIYTEDLPSAIYFLKLHRPVTGRSDETFKIVKQY